jgi:linoleoyl-CoA desaturase
MHDGAHGSFSKHEWLNSLAGHTLSMLGASVALWKNKHNAIHHTFTNIDGIDDDIEAGGMIRMADSQPHKGIHRMQHYYWPLLYSLLYIYWLAFTDFKKYFSGKVGDVPIRKFTPAEHIGFWFWKVTHTTMVVVLPIYFIGFLPWLFGFLLMTFITGFSLSVVFQLAHVVEGVSFKVSDTINPTNIESEWAVHQLQTTANFATRSRSLTWLLGGLNYQVEHHLFPRISHVHYPAISRIVKETCAEFNVQYQEFRTFADALNAHVRHLKRLSVA